MTNEQRGRELREDTEAGVDTAPACAPFADAPSDADLGAEADASVGNRALEHRTVRVFGEPGLPGVGVVQTDVMAAEIPVALVFNGISHAVMMATPLHLEEFAIGFALSEGIVASAADVRGVEVLRAGPAAQLPQGISGLEVHLDISTQAFERLKQRRRSMSGRTGCGVCGVESLAALDMAPERVPTRSWIGRVDLGTVLAAFAALASAQPLHADAGSLHAAGWVSLGGPPHGQLVQVFEDVGRHNALDKLIGWLAGSRHLAQPGFVVLSSRASHELVRKCARVGIAALATISAPTATGVLLAENAGIRLWGLCRAPRGVLYASGEVAEHPGHPAFAVPRAGLASSGDA